jgi:ADP-heptose:LPS heptosyltransferase
VNIQARKILIIQLEKDVEILQTYIACSQFKLEHPEHDLHVVTRKEIKENFSFLLKSTFSKLHIINVKDYFTNSELKSARQNLNSNLTSLNQENYDLIINFSKNKSSTFLLSLIQAKAKMGFARNEYAQLAIQDKWSQYIYANIINGKLNSFNLVDVYKQMLGSKHNYQIDCHHLKNKTIAINPFCSSDKQQWNITKWNEVIYKLLRDDDQLKIIILGEKEDYQQSLEIINSPIFSVVRNRITNLTGQTNREQVYSLLMNVEMLLGHNTYIAHLAAIFGLPSVIIAQGSSTYSHSAPYNVSSYTLTPKNSCFPCFETTKCDLKPCQTGINHQLVTAIAKTILNNHEVTWPSLSKYITAFHVENASIHQSNFDNFGLQHSDILNSDLTASDYFKLLYRIIWSYYLGHIELKTKLPNCSNFTIKTLNQHIEGCNYLFELYGHAFNFSNQILIETEKENPNIENIHALVNKISEIDKLCDITSKTFSFLQPLINFFYTNHLNAAGNNIVEVSGNNMISYHEAINIVTVMADLLEQTIKPRMGKLNNQFSL